MSHTWFCKSRSVQALPVLLEEGGPRLLLLHLSCWPSFSCCFAASFITFLCFRKPRWLRHRVSGRSFMYGTQVSCHVNEPCQYKSKSCTVVIIVWCWLTQKLLSKHCWKSDFITRVHNCQKRQRGFEAAGRGPGEILFPNPAEPQSPSYKYWLIWVILLWIRANVCPVLKCNIWLPGCCFFLWNCWDSHSIQFIIS